MSIVKKEHVRHKSDYYVTPKEEVKLFLENFIKDLSIQPSQLVWLDPCAGGCWAHDMSYPAIINTYNPLRLDTIDIREDSRALIKGDYLTINLEKDLYDIAITNPPFLYAQEVIEKALEDVKWGGYVAMFLRLNFFGSARRWEFWQQQMPILCYVHHKRPSFDGEGTDRTEYAHMVWQRGVYPEYTKLKLI